MILPTDLQGRDHPLVAVWKRSAEYPVHEALSRGAYRVRSLLPDLRVRRVDPDRYPGIDLDRTLINLNWPDDLKRLG